MKTHNLVLLRHESPGFQWVNTPVVSKDSAVIARIKAAGAHSMGVVLADHVFSNGVDLGRVRPTYQILILKRDLHDLCKDFKLELLSRSSAALAQATFTVDLQVRLYMTRDTQLPPVATDFFYLLPGPGDATNWNYKQQTFLRPCEQCILPGINVHLGRDIADFSVSNAKQAKMAPPTISMEAAAWDLVSMLFEIKQTDDSYTGPLCFERRMCTLLHACTSSELSIIAHQPAASYPECIAKPFTHAAAILMDCASTATIAQFRWVGSEHASASGSRLQLIREFAKGLKGGEAHIDVAIINSSIEHGGMAYCNTLMFALNPELQDWHFSTIQLYILAMSDIN